MVFGLKKTCGKCPVLHPKGDWYYLYESKRVKGKVVQKYLGKGRMDNPTVVQDSPSRVLVEGEPLVLVAADGKSVVQEKRGFLDGR